jgi:ketosteroid isomerase-like protein
VSARADDPAIGLFRQAISAFRAQDVPRMGALLSPDAVLWMSGTSRLAGLHKDREAVLTFGIAVAELMDLTTIDIEEIAVDEREVRAVTSVDLVQPDGRRLRVRMLPRIHFDSEDRVLDVWVEAEDQEAFDRFVGAEEAAT